MFEIIPNWHPVFVHYALALPTVSAVAYVVSMRAKTYSIKYHAGWLARWSLWVGAGFVGLAVLAGLYAYFTVNHDGPSHIAMNEHRNWALFTAPWVMGLAGWAYWMFRNDKEEPRHFVLAVVAGALLLTITAWHGAELVYRYGLGVISLPVPEGVGHDHGDAVPHAHSSSNVVAPTLPAAPPSRGDAGAAPADPITNDAHSHAEPHEHADEQAAPHEHPAP